MAKLVQRGAVEIDLIVERLLRRQLDAIECRHVISFGATDADPRAARHHQRLRHRDDLSFAKRRRYARDIRRQTLALIDIEHRKSFQKRDLPRLAVTALLAISALRREAIRVTDSSPRLAFADIAAQRLRLPVGKPSLRGEAALEQSCPQDQDIDARVAPPGPRIARHAHARLRPVPWLNPRHPPRFQFCDDPVRDLAIKRGRLMLR